MEDSKNKIDPKTKKCFVDYLENLMIQTIVGTKLFELIFLEAVKILIVNSSKYTSFICDLFEESFRILEKVSEKCKTETIIHNLTDIVLLVVQIYHVSLASLAVRPATIVHLQKLIEHFKKS